MISPGCRQKFVTPGLRFYPDRAVRQHSQAGREDFMDNQREPPSTSRVREPLRRDYGQLDLQRLLSFYLACIEEEDLRSLTLRLSQLHH